MCAVAALRSGAGWVTWAGPKSILPDVRRRGRWEVMSLALAEKQGVVSAAAVPVVRRFIKNRRVTALAVGPGLSGKNQAVEFVRRVLRCADVPVVLDADGLRALHGGFKNSDGRALVITPHPGEMGRLLGISSTAVQARRLACAVAASRKYNAICVLKGHRTLITDGRRVIVNPTGNPGMATGGTGDVLCGLLAGLAGQMRGATAHEKLWRAAVTAVYLHGLAGDLAVRKTTRLGLTASDLIDYLPRAYRTVYGNSI